MQNLKPLVTSSRYTAIVLCSAFVHLGGLPPKHLLLNLHSQLKKFPNIPVFLITDKPENFKKIDSNIIVFKYARSEQHKSIFINLDDKFRKGFWVLTIERLFALNQFHKSNPSLRILHIESDVILFPNFPWLKFLEQEKLAWGLYNKNHDVAALLYTPNPTETNFLVSELEFILSKENQITDMTALSIVRIKNQERITILPSFANSNSIMVNMNSSITQSEKLLASSMTDHFAGVFDNLALGVWLTGFDPRNSFGFTIVRTKELFITGDSYLDPQMSKFERNSQDRIFVISDNEKTELFSLHVHSKNLKLFSPNWQRELDKLISYENRKIHKFSSTILFKLIIVNLRQKTLIRFLLAVPMLSKLKKFKK